MLMFIQILVKFCPLVLKILSRNEILTSIKGRNSVVNLRNLTLNNPNLDIIYVSDLSTSASCVFYAKNSEMTHKKLSVRTIDAGKFGAISCAVLVKLVLFCL